MILGLLLLAGCQQQQVEPSLLFRTWQQVDQDGKSIQYALQVEFTASGTLLYGQDKRPGGCCVPARFKGINRQLEFLGPAATDPQCGYVLCGASQLAVGPWQIEKLTATELTLAAGSSRLFFQ